MEKFKKISFVLSAVLLFGFGIVWSLNAPQNLPIFWLFIFVASLPSIIFTVFLQSKIKEKNPISYTFLYGIPSIPMFTALIWVFLMPILSQILDKNPLEILNLGFFVQIFVLILVTVWTHQNYKKAFFSEKMLQLAQQEFADYELLIELRDSLQRVEQSIGQLPNIMAQILIPILLKIREHDEKFKQIEKDIIRFEATFDFFEEKFVKHGYELANLNKSLKEVENLSQKIEQIQKDIDENVEALANLQENKASHAKVEELEKKYQEVLEKQAQEQAKIEDYINQTFKNLYNAFIKANREKISFKEMENEAEKKFGNKWDNLNTFQKDHLAGVILLKKSSQWNASLILMGNFIVLESVLRENIFEKFKKQIQDNPQKADIQQKCYRYDTKEYIGQVKDLALFVFEEQNIEFGKMINSILDSLNPTNKENLTQQLKISLPNSIKKDIISIFPSNTKYYEELRKLINLRNKYAHGGNELLSKTDINHHEKQILDLLKCFL